MAFVSHGAAGCGPWTAAGTTPATVATEATFLAHGAIPAVNRVRRRSLPVASSTRFPCVVEATASAPAAAAAVAAHVCEAAQPTTPTGAEAPSIGPGPRRYCPPLSSQTRIATGSGAAPTQAPPAQAARTQAAHRGTTPPAVVATSRGAQTRQAGRRDQRPIEQEASAAPTGTTVGRKMEAPRRTHRAPPSVTNAGLSANPASGGRRGRGPVVMERRRGPGEASAGREGSSSSQKANGVRARTDRRRGAAAGSGGGGSGAAGASGARGGEGEAAPHHYEERNFRRRVEQTRRGAWSIVLRDLDGAEAAAAATTVDTDPADSAGPVVTLPMYSTCIQFMARAQRGQEAVLILDRIRKAGLEPDLRCLNFAISACGRSGRWEQALRILRGTEGSGSSHGDGAGVVAGGGAGKTAADLDVYCWSSAVDACGRAGKWREAVSLVEEMQTEEVGISPNVITYNAAITACRKGKQCDRAIALLRDMPRRGVSPNVASYSSAIAALGDAGRWQDAISLFREMPDVDLAPDMMSFTATISACAGISRSRRGLSPGEKGGPVGKGGGTNGNSSVGGRFAPSSVAQGEVSAATSPSGPRREPWEEALALLGEMLPSAGVTPNVFHFNAAVSACAACGRWEEAVSLLGEMERAAVPPDLVTYSAAIAACGNGLQFERALMLLREMPEKGVEPNAFHYNAAISACAKCGRYESALELLREMWEVSAREEEGAKATGSGLRKAAGIRPDAFSYSSAITACRNGNNLERASELKREMRERGITGGGSLMKSLLSEIP